MKITPAGLQTPNLGTSTECFRLRGKLQSAPPIPIHEDERLARVRELKSSSAFDHELNEIAHRATIVCGVSGAYLCLLEKYDEVIVGAYGHSQTSFPRDSSLCAYAAMNPNEVIVLSDARLHPLVSQHPLVIGPESIRLFAAAPLVVDSGLVVGALCVTDPSAHDLERRDETALKTLAREAVGRLEIMAMTWPLA